MKKVITSVIMGVAVLIASTPAFGAKLTQAQIDAMQAELQQEIAIIMPPTNVPAPVNRPRRVSTNAAPASPMGSPAQPAGQQSQTPPVYAVTDLGTLGGASSIAYAINNNGQIVGEANTSSSGAEYDAFLWSGMNMQDLGKLPGQPSSVGTSINNQGQVVGCTFEHAPSLSGFGWLWSNNTQTQIPPQNAASINDNGQVVGLAKSGAILWQNGSTNDLGSLGAGGTIPESINNLGQVVGSSDVGSFYDAFLWQNGTMQDLGTLSGQKYSEAMCINNGGQIVGFSGPYAFLWENGSMQNLGTLSGYTFSMAFCVNDGGAIVGESDNGNGNGHAFLWQNGSMYDLNSLLFNPNSGWNLQQATGINDNGQICGYGTNPQGQTHAFLLNPLPFGASFACTNVQARPPGYPAVPIPQPGQDSLVLVTHGWIDSLFMTHAQIGAEAEEATNFVNTTTNEIAQYLASQGLNNWQVYGYLWTDQATRDTPMGALASAYQQGESVGDQIVAMGMSGNGWKHIHFIAHSAGAGLIQRATEIIKTNLPGVTVQCTFLDAYDGVDGSHSHEYGTDADWADSYFVRDSYQIAGYTGRVLPNAYNVDVTGLDPSNGPAPWYESPTGPFASCYETLSGHGHGWPTFFYTNSVLGAISPTNLDSIYNGSYYSGFGFPLSQEAGDLASIASTYPEGNGITYGAVAELGPDTGCTASYLATPSYVGKVPGYSVPSTVQSTTGTILSGPGTATMGTGSPVWLATVITDTNSLNCVTFNAEFTSASGADGLLTVYWDTNMVGEIDEAAVPPGLQLYTFTFPNTAPNTSHVLGFHVDPFTSVHSTLVLTNIVTGCLGISQPPVLTVTTNTNGGLRAYQMTGQPGVYSIQSSPDLANWTNIALLMNTNGSVLFTDPNSTNCPYLFYRAVAQTDLTQ